MTSYFDWEKSFKTPKEPPKKESKKNSLGIPDKELKEFLKNWRQKNLEGD